MDQELDPMKGHGMGLPEASPCLPLPVSSLTPLPDLSAPFAPLLLLALSSRSLGLPISPSLKEF